MPRGAIHSMPYLKRCLPVYCRQKPSLEMGVVSAAAAVVVAKPCEYATTTNVDVRQQ